MAKRAIDKCSTVLCALTDFGEWNQENKELMLYAKSRGKLCQLSEFGKEGEFDIYHPISL